MAYSAAFGCDRTSARPLRHDPPRPPPRPARLRHQRTHLRPAALPARQLLHLGPRRSPRPRPLPDAPRHAGVDHPPKAFNEPCGTAVDRHGDVYVSSSVSTSARPEGRIDVFNAKGEYLTEIKDPHQPCNLAVDSEGNVYVAEYEGKNAVLFKAKSFPPAKGATYEGPLIVKERTGSGRRICAQTLVASRRSRQRSPLRRHRLQRSDLRVRLGRQRQRAAGRTRQRRAGGKHRRHRRLRQKPRHLRQRHERRSPWQRAPRIRQSLRLRRRRRPRQVRDRRLRNPAGRLRLLLRHWPASPLTKQTATSTSTTSQPTRWSTSSPSAQAAATTWASSNTPSPRRAAPSAPASRSTTPTPASPATTAPTKASSTSPPARSRPSTTSGRLRRWGKRGAKQHKLTVTVIGEGSVSADTGTISGCTAAGGPACEGTYVEGAEVTLTETPKAGNLFAGWQTLQCDESTAPTCTITIGSADEGVAASFEAEPQEPGIALEVSTEGSGSGTVTSDSGLISCQPFCSDEYPEGTESHPHRLALPRLALRCLAPLRQRRRQRPPVHGGARQSQAGQRRLPQLPTSSPSQRQKARAPARRRAPAGRSPACMPARGPSPPSPREPPSPSPRPRHATSTSPAGKATAKAPAPAS